MALWLAKKSPPLYGTVNISTSKNSTLPIMAACLLIEGQSHLVDLPALTDINIMRKILESLGVNIRVHGKDIRLSANNLASSNPPYELIKSMRASFLCMGPLLARVGSAFIPPPGGCNIGDRPIDLHLKGFRKLGANIIKKDGGLLAEGKLKGAVINLDFPSVGATENIIMAAALAQGDTLIINAAREPEIIDLCDFLRKAGAKISGDGSKIIKITGVKTLSGIKYRPIGDRMEAGTFMYATAILGGDVVLQNTNINHVDVVSNNLTKAGSKIAAQDYSLNIKSIGINKNINITTAPHPGFPTDLQAPAMVLASLSQGNCIIKEDIFENRLNHAHELMRLGANIKLKKRCAVISGQKNLYGTEVFASDLRAGAALVLAGLAANGTTTIHDTGHIKRGYDGFGVKLSSIGANLSLLPDI